MTKVDVTVINKAFKGIPVGGSTSVSEKDARILVALKRVAMAKAAPTYQTRMMTAEAPVQAVAPAVEPNDLSIAVEQLHAMLDSDKAAREAAPAEPAVFVTEPAEPQKRQYIRRRPLDAPPDAQTE